MSGMQRPQGGGTGNKHIPTPETRAVVTALAATGNTKEEIAIYLGTGKRTLDNHYRSELNTAYTKVKAACSGLLVKKALAGDKACLFFLLKTKFGYREVNRYEHTGANGAPIDIKGLSNEQLLQAIASLETGTDQANASDGAGATTYENQPSGLV